MESLPENYLTYHFSRAYPEFLSSIPKRFEQNLEFVNIWNLLKTFFKPYKRLTLSKKTTIFDRISFNLISAGVGAGARFVLILTGLLILFIFVLYYMIAAIFYLIPIFSFGNFIKYKNNTFFDTDLENTQKLLAKLNKSPVFKDLTIFFERDFIQLLSTLPTPTSLGINTNQSSMDMITTISQKWPYFKSYLENKNIDFNEFNLLLNYLHHYHLNPPPSKPTPIGYSLVYGYTNTLDQFSTEITYKKVSSPFFNKSLVEKIEKVLNRPKANNALLTGDVGVGRHAGVNDLAQAITRQQVPSLKDKRVLFLDTIAMLGSSKNLMEIKSKFESILEEAKHAGNIILVIDSIDKISSSADGRIDLTQVLSNVLTDNTLPIVGITTIDDFNKYTRFNPSFFKLFEKVEIEEPGKEETINILINKILEYNHEKKISATYQSLIEIVEKTENLIQDRRQPEKSIITLEDSISSAQSAGKNQVTIEIVDKILAERTKVPVGKISKTELAKLKDLESFLHRRIIGQNEAIVEISKAMRRARTGIERSNGPMGSFLFLGPTGVGKTETAKALADAYFGQENKMVRLDMSEFQTSDSIKRLIGDNLTQTPGQLTAIISQNPYGLFLVDEFEKANPNIANLFLQILDEGKLTDAFGKKVNFTNMIIIATSNAGAEFIREQVKKQINSSQSTVSRQNQTVNPEPLTNKLIEHVLSKGFFNPELVNRFDAVVVYQPLTQKEVVEIAKLMLNQLATQIKDTKNIKLEINDTLAQIVAQKGFNIQFGARPIRRLIADKIEDGIAKMIINNQVTTGATIPAQTLLQFVA